MLLLTFWDRTEKEGIPISKQRAMELPEKNGRVVCVTGAGGFVGSWLVKLLLANSYIVHATVRNPSEHQKNAHLWKFDKAAENLKLFKADILNYESLLTAFEGCIGVFHVACPVPSASLSNPEEELIEPAVNGTLNVLKACYQVKVKRLVAVSSIAAVVKNPSWPKDQVIDEACWSDTTYCRRTENWYFTAKTEAEQQTLEYGEKYELDVVTICPSLVLGPALQSTVNTSSLFLIMLLKGTMCIEHMERRIVDVRDLSEALVLLFEKLEAKGRYLCSSHTVEVQEMARILKKIYPNYVYIDPKMQGHSILTSKVYKYEEVELEGRLSSEKLQRLGWTYRPLEETLADSIDSYKQAGYLS